MKKKMISLLLVLAMMLGLVACSSGGSVETEAPAAESVEETVPVEVPEVDTIHWARAASANVFITIAKEKGYLEEVGLDIIEDPMASQTDAFTALSTGQLDVAANYGTITPLAQIASGQEFSIVGGYMMQGAFVVAKKGTGWNGVSDFVGKTMAVPATQTPLTEAMLREGYDPLNDVEWLYLPVAADRLAAVISGEADYAALSGDMLYTVGNMDEVEIVTYHGDVTPYYGCCRMVMRTDFVENNPITVKLLLKALLRAECYLSNNLDEGVTLLARELGTEEEFVAAYLKNPHYELSIDPVRNAVLNTWNVMIETGYLEESLRDYDIDSHINIDLYKAALEEAVEDYYDEDPEFWDGRLKFFEENNY